MLLQIIQPLSSVITQEGAQQAFPDLPEQTGESLGKITPPLLITHFNRSSLSFLLFSIEISGNNCGGKIALECLLRNYNWIQKTLTDSYKRAKKNDAWFDQSNEQTRYRPVSLEIKRLAWYWKRTRLFLYSREGYTQVQTASYHRRDCNGRDCIRHHALPHS